MLQNVVLVSLKAANKKIPQCECKENEFDSSGADSLNKLLYMRMRFSIDKAQSENWLHTLVAKVTSHGLDFRLGIFFEKRFCGNFGRN